MLWKTLIFFSFYFQLNIILNATKSPNQGHPIYILQDLSGIGDIFGKYYWQLHQQQIEKGTNTISNIFVSGPFHIGWCNFIHAINSPHGHITLLYGVSLFNIHSPFFRITIVFDILNWLFTSKGGNRICSFFPTYCSDVCEQISNHRWWSTLLFVHF